MTTAGWCGVDWQVQHARRALGATTDNPHHGPTHNPWRHDYTPGGSSGGSAAAVAAKFCAGAQGTDTMGSVRLPAAYCGLVGLKPSYSPVSTRGVVPLSYGPDHVDPLCCCVRGISLMQDVLTGYNPACVESVYPHCTLHARPVNLAGLRFAVPLNDAATPFGKGIWENFKDCITKLEDHGAIQVSCSLPDLDPTRSRLAGLLICEAEAGHALQGALPTSPGDFSKDMYRDPYPFPLCPSPSRLPARPRTPGGSWSVG